MDELQNSPIQYDDGLYGKEAKAIPTPEKNIGIDQHDIVFSNIVEAGTASTIDLSSIESLSQISQNRSQIYDLFDTMAEDVMISAALEIYGEDATVRNDQGKIIWAEAVKDDTNASSYVNYLLTSLQVDKKVYSWVYNLCKYGDVYLRLYRNSEIDAIDKKKKETKNLKEAVYIKAYRKDDKLSHYIEMVPNPAEIFELTKFGKTYAYIQAPTALLPQKVENMSNYTYLYKFKNTNIDIYNPTSFVHAALEGKNSRAPESVSIFTESQDLDSDSTNYNYNVRRGQSILSDVFKIWRELMLLQNAVLLNRVTKSSILRVVKVEVGDMPKEKINTHLMGIKRLFEQKAAIDQGSSLTEYTNPGPIENIIYVPTHNGVGNLDTMQVGGDVDVKSLADLDYFKTRLYAGLSIPGPYLGDVDESSGFDGGTSLSLRSSRYAKRIMRIQSTIIQMITDLINIYLLDTGNERYIGKFAIKMQSPATEEEDVRRATINTKVQTTQDIMSMIESYKDDAYQLNILKALLSNIVTDNTVMELIDQRIEELESQDEDDIIDDEDTVIDLDNGEDEEIDLNIDDDNFGEDLDLEGELLQEDKDKEERLPSPEELGIDFSDNDQDF